MPEQFTLIVSAEFSFVSHIKEIYLKYVVGLV